MDDGKVLATGTPAELMRGRGPGPRSLLHPSPPEEKRGAHGAGHTPLGREIEIVIVPRA
jgi:hypothetical protein